MKVVISEKQLANLIGKHKEIDEAASDSTSASPSSDTTSSTSTSTTDDNFPSSPDTDDTEPYPSGVTKWPDQGQSPKRGVANPVGRVQKRENHPEAEPGRGPDNQIR